MCCIVANIDCYCVYALNYRIVKIFQGINIKNRVLYEQIESGPANVHTE